jgi:NhaP-type Na+/H+ and K+/H+ antiporter
LTVPYIFILCGEALIFALHGWFCVSAIVTFFIMGLFKGNFEWFEWDNLIPVVGGLIGITIGSYKDKSS